MSVFKKLFTKETDRKVEELYEENKATLESVASVAKRHRDLLKKDGVTMQIYIATGEGKHGR